MSKKFSTIEEQLALLNSRGVETDNDTASILLCEGYYSIVNGYKDPFLNQEESAKAGDDRYIAGTHFSDLYSLFQFDRDLRERAFHYLLRVEAIVRTVCVYTFVENHQGKEAYLRQDSFASEDEYKKFGLRNYLDNLHKLHNTLHDAIDKPKNEAVEHYKKNHDEVPLWVLMNTLTFGNVQHFFNLMKPEEQAAVCERIATLPGRINTGFLTPVKMRRAVDVLVKFRNICAHDERLYCAMVGKRNPADLMDCVRYSALFLSQNEAFEFFDGILDMLTDYTAKSSALIHVFNKTGLSRVRKIGVAEFFSMKSDKQKK